MIKIGLVLVSLGIGCVIALWPKSHAITGAPTAQSLPIEELHTLAPHVAAILNDHVFAVYCRVPHRWRGEAKGRDCSV